MRALSGHHLMYLHRKVGNSFVTNKTITNFSESKQIH